MGGTMKKRIMLDPGHGGFQTGAYNAFTDKKEKVINLQIARYVRRYINYERPDNYSCFMTRHGDDYVGLTDRCAMALDYEVDLFLSIHCDAYEEPPFIDEVEGIGTLYFHPEAHRFATILQSNLMAEFSDHKNRGVKRRDNLTVLKSGVKNSVLVECEFIDVDEMSEWLAFETTGRLYGRAIGESIFQTLAE